MSVPKPARVLPRSISARLPLSCLPSTLLALSVPFACQPRQIMPQWLLKVISLGLLAPTTGAVTVAVNPGFCPGVCPQSLRGLARSPHPACKSRLRLPRANPACKSRVQTRLRLGSCLDSNGLLYVSSILLLLHSWPLCGHVGALRQQRSAALSAVSIYFTSFATRLTVVFASSPGRSIDISLEVALPPGDC